MLYPIRYADSTPLFKFAWNISTQFSLSSHHFVQLHSLPSNKRMFLALLWFGLLVVPSLFRHFQARVRNVYVLTTHISLWTESLPSLFGDIFEHVPNKEISWDGKFLPRPAPWETGQVLVLMHWECTQHLAGYKCTELLQWTADSRRVVAIMKLGDPELGSAAQP